MRDEMRERRGFWLAIVLLALVAGGKAIVADTLDPDCFWHLKVAEQLERDGIGPIVDHMSFASIREPWTPYSWLAEMGMHRLWDFGGYRAAVAAQAVMQALFVVLIAMACAQFAPTRRFACVIATAAAMYLALPYLSFRPATFGLLILAGCAVLLLRERRIGNTRAVWIVVPLTALLANVHLMVVFVPVWALCLMRGRAKPQAAVMLAALATPMLSGAIHTAIHYGFADVMVRGPVIAEMQPFYRGAMGWVTGAILLGMAVCFWRRREMLGSGMIVCIIVSAICMLRVGRFAPILAIIAAPALAVTLPRMRDAVLAEISVLAAMSVVIALAGWRIAIAFPNADWPMQAWINRHTPIVPGYPCAAAAFVEQNIRPQSCRIVNEFNWGGYLEWRLGRQFQVLLDGRTQLYSGDFWRATYLGSPQRMQRILAGVNADAAIVPARKSHFIDALKELGWTRVYSDEQAEVLVPPQTRIADVGN